MLFFASFFVFYAWKTSYNNIGAAVALFYFITGFGFGFGGWMEPEVQ